MISRHGYQQLARDLKTDPRKTVMALREDLLAGVYKPEEFSIRHLAENCVEGGREWVATMDPRYGDGLYLEAAGAVSTVNFSNIMGQIAFSKVMQAYQREEFVFTNLVETIPSMLRSEKVPGIGGIGNNAEIVNEGKPYPLVGVNEDWIETPTTTKRGMIIPATKEAIFFDRTNLVLSRCNEVGEYLGVNKEIRIIDALIDENVTAHRYIWKGTTYATYASSGGHGVVNLKTSNTLTDWTSIDAALLVASQITDPWTGLPVVNVGSDLVVAQQLVATAGHIVNATQNIRHGAGYATSGVVNGQTLDRNPILGINGYSPAMYNVRTSKLLSSRMATKTSWFIGDIQKQIGYWENWPLTVVQAPQNSEAEFTQDIVLRLKASEMGAAGHKDVRYIVKSTVA